MDARNQSAYDGLTCLLDHAELSDIECDFLLDIMDRVWGFCSERNRLAWDRGKSEWEDSLLSDAAIRRGQHPDLSGTILPELHYTGLPEILVRRIVEAVLGRTENDGAFQQDFSD